MDATQIAKDNFGIVLDSDIKASLNSKVKKIDRGYYPKHILRALAKQGYFTNNIANTKIINDIDSISNLKPKANKSDFRF